MSEALSEPRRIVIIGAGPAGVGAAMGARAQDAAAEITLLSEENCEPYEKPPLSKAVLTGKAAAHDAPIAGPKGIAGHGVTIRHNTRVSTIDRGPRAVVASTGERIPYDALVLATGARNRLLPMFPLGQPGIYYLRNHEEAVALKAHLDRAESVVVIGGGLIGLEVAASAAELGRKVTVIEVAPRILNRVADEETSAFVHARHVEHGVDIRLGASIAKRDGHSLVLASGERIEADLFVVGIGAVPDDALAAAAGLDVKEGIIVDEQCRTSDPAIFAAGDATRFPGPHGPVRLENWRHAQEQGDVAGRNAAGASVAYGSAPSFWSEQYDLYIQGVGWQLAQPARRARRARENGAPLNFELDSNHLTYALGINAQRDMSAIRRLIERKIPVDPADLVDPAKPLAGLLKPKA